MPDLDKHILQIIDGSTYGNPEKVLSYTTMSLRTIQEKLAENYNEIISFRSIGTILEKLGYSKQANQKMLQVGEPHPDRNLQFEFINSKAEQFLKQGLPVISVDTKKKENIGNFKNKAQSLKRTDFYTNTGNISNPQITLVVIEMVSPNERMILFFRFVTLALNLKAHHAK